MSEDKKYLVYKLTSPSGKHYIGFTSRSLEHRVAGHLDAYRRCIQRGQPLSRFYSACKKYPVKLWQREILFESSVKEEATDVEKRMIKEYNTQDQNYGYNIADGGMGGLIGTGQLGRHWKIKDTSNMHKPKTKTKKLLLAHERHKGEGNYQFEGWYITPWGNFSSLQEAISNAKVKRQNGEITISDEHTLQKYCKTHCNIPLNKSGTPDTSSVER